VDEFGADCSLIPGSDRPPKKNKKGTIAANRDFLPTLVGQRTIPCTLLLDPEDGEKKLFFVYTDISPRIVGIFKLRCDIMDMNRFRFH
jgi:hypothetical protein